MKTRMEINNVTLDPQDNKYQNFYLEKIGDEYEGYVPDYLRKEAVILEFNKRTNLSCLQALSLDTNQG